MTSLPFHLREVKYLNRSTCAAKRTIIYFAGLCLLCVCALHLQVTRKLLADALNSATGMVFDNSKKREFTGERLKLSETGSSHNLYPPIKTFAPSCKRWAVVTTIFDPSVAIARAASMPLWCTVIVPDLNTPPGFMQKFKSQINNTAILENVFFFSVKLQKEWGNSEGPLGELARLTPWSHFARKNIGYLFAIAHGAEFIFDFDDDNLVKLSADGSPLKILPDDDAMVLENVDIVGLGGNAFNHHPIMQASVEESWARGFPIELIKDYHTRGKVLYNTNIAFSAEEPSNKEIGVIQFLADDNPDIDAIHRMSRPLPMTFPEENAPSMLVPLHAYAPYNAQATIHTKNALFATLLPFSVPGRVTDIWRGYFAQCIFHDTGLRLVFSPPKIKQERNEHNLLGDLNAEQDLYAKSGELIKFLSSWDSDDDPNKDSVPKRMEKLWIDLYEREYIELEDVHSLQKWLGALDQVGYNFPKLKRRFRNVAVMGQFNYAKSPTIVDDVIFWTQKLKEHATTVIAAAPFTDEQVEELENNSVKVIKGESDRGWYSPLKNHIAALQGYKDDTTIQSVLYTHDDGILNFTELSRGQYPYPADEFMMVDQQGPKYSIFPDGHVTEHSSGQDFPSIKEMYDGLATYKWPQLPKSHCGGGQTSLAKDPRSDPYREEDGSVLFQHGQQSDFAQIPTKYADAATAAATLQNDHKIWIECSYKDVMNMIPKTNPDAESTDATGLRKIGLCTKWNNSRGGLGMLNNCLADASIRGFYHPYKINRQGYEHWSDIWDMLQGPVHVVD